MADLKLVQSSENGTSPQKHLQNKSITARHGTGKQTDTCSLPAPSNRIHIPEVPMAANWSSDVLFTTYSKSHLKPLSKRWNDSRKNILVSYMLAFFPISQTSWKTKLRAWNKDTRGSLCTAARIKPTRKTLIRNWTRASGLYVNALTIATTCSL